MEGWVRNNIFINYHFSWKSMERKHLATFFEDFLDRDTLFRNRSVLLSSFMPDTVLYREEEKNQTASILAPALKKERPSNVFIYGNTGTGKTLTIRHITDTMQKVAQEKHIPFKVVYVNCKLKRVADTEYRLIAHIASFFGKAIPSTGLPTDEVYRIFYNGIEQEQGVILLILDEIDQLIKKTGDDILYNLTRSNEELQNTQISIVGISNDTTFLDNLDMRVRSSLSEESIFFAPYNAIQMQTILRERANLAFKEDSLDQGVIEKCAAFAAREHGDARKAIELLRVAAEMAERNKEKKIMLVHIDEAQDNLEKEKIFDIIKNQPKQYQAVLYSVLTLKSSLDSIYTGETYDLYSKICFKAGLRPLTQRRVSDILNDFEQMGVIKAKTISKGRYGRTREISIGISQSTKPQALKILEESLELQNANP